MTEEKFDLEYSPKTGKNDIEYYSLNIPYDIFDGAELAEDGNFRMYIYENELKQLYKLIGDKLKER